MADSSTNLDILSSGQSGKEVTANDLFDAGSPATLLGRRASTTAGLTWGYYGGVVALDDGTLLQVANGTKTLTDNATNYIELDTADGSVDLNTSAWTSGKRRLYAVVTSGGAVTSYTDWRTPVAPAADDGTVEAGDVNGLSEAIDDRVAALIQAVGLTLTYDDAGNLLTISLPAQPFDASAFYPGVPGASAKVLRVPIARAVTFPANFANSVGTASANATASTAFGIQKNGVSVGTMTFAAGASSATFTSSGGAAVSFAAGDVLAVIAPATPDATLADVGLVLAGTR